MTPKVAADGMFRCSRCQVFKPKIAFGIRSNRRIGIQSHCLDCESARGAARSQTTKYKQRVNHWNAVNVERRRFYRIKSLYGASREWHDAILAAQGGVCAICRMPETQRDRKGDVKRLAVDHNRATGALRGLLCLRCNTCIERLEAVPGWGEKAAAYLASHG